MAQPFLKFVEFQLFWPMLKAALVLRDLARRQFGELRVCIGDFESSDYPLPVLRLNSAEKGLKPVKVPYRQRVDRDRLGASHPTDKCPSGYRRETRPGELVERGT